MPQDFEMALTAELKSIPTLSDRVYPLVAPDADAGAGTPYLIYLSDYGIPTRTHSGRSGGRTVTLELNIMAERYETLKSVVSSVVNQVYSFVNRKIGSDGPFVQEVFLVTQPFETYEAQPKLYRSVLEFEVYYI